MDNMRVLVTQTPSMGRSEGKAFGLCVQSHSSRVPSWQEEGQGFRNGLGSSVAGEAQRLKFAKGWGVWCWLLSWNLLRPANGAQCLGWRFLEVSQLNSDYSDSDRGCSGFGGSKLTWHLDSRVIRKVGPLRNDYESWKYPIYWDILLRIFSGFF